GAGDGAVGRTLRLTVAGESRGSLAGRGAGTAFMSTVAGVSSLSVVGVGRALSLTVCGDCSSVAAFNTTVPASSAGAWGANGPGSLTDDFRMTVAGASSSAGGGGVGRGIAAVRSASVTGAVAIVSSLPRAPNQEPRQYSKSRT